MASVNTSTSANALAACTDVPGLNVTLTVPQAGTVVVQSTIMFMDTHVTGARDEVDLTTATTKATCTNSNPWTTFMYVSAAEASGTYWPQVFMQRALNVTAAGTYTFYVNGAAFLGAGASAVYRYRSMVAVFYPR